MGADLFGEQALVPEGLEGTMHDANSVHLLSDVKGTVCASAVDEDEFVGDQA